MAESHELLLEALDWLELQPEAPSLKALYEKAGVSRATVNRNKEVLARFRALQSRKNAAIEAGNKNLSSKANRPANASKNTNRLLRRSIDDWANLVQVLQLRISALEEEVHALRSGDTSARVVPFVRRSQD